ncbi:MAG: hypothetical protein U9R54_05395 [Bacteroidota bacterium]|nr:hypothetical protein [Bacteroidota bacterium]
MKKFYLLIGTVLLLGIFFSCEKDELSTSGTVKYEVTCSPSGFDITYENSSGNTEQKTITSGSWATSFTGNQGDFVYVSAQADNENANITAKIYYKGDIIEQASSSGAYVIATASGSLP